MSPSETDLARSDEVFYPRRLIQSALGRSKSYTARMSLQPGANSDVRLKAWLSNVDVRKEMEDERWLAGIETCDKAAGSKANENYQ